MVDRTTGVPVNATLDDYKVPTMLDTPPIRSSSHRCPTSSLNTVGAKGLGEPPIIPTAAAIANAFRARHRPPPARAAPDAGPRAGAARMTTTYARPGNLGEALHLLAQPGARPLGGGTDLAGQLDRGLTSAADHRRPAGARPRRRSRPRRRRRASAAPPRSPTSPRATSWRRGRSSARPRRRRRRRSCATRAPSAATSASTRAAGTTAASSGTAGSAAATPATRRSASTASTTCSPATASRRTRPTSRRRCWRAARRSHLQSAHGERELQLADLYRRPTEQNRSLIDLDAGRDRDRRRAAGAARRLRLPAPRRAARLLVPARQRRRRRGSAASVRWPRAASPTSRCELDPADPLADLPGNPESAWKRTVVATLVARGLEAVGA